MMKLRSPSIPAALLVSVALFSSASIANDCPTLASKYRCKYPDGDQIRLKVVQTGQGTDTAYTFRNYYYGNREAPHLEKFVADNVLREDPYGFFENTYSRAWCDLDPGPTLHIYSEARHESGRKLILNQEYRDSPTVTITRWVGPSEGSSEKAPTDAVAHCKLIR